MSAELPYNLDYDWYINEAVEMLQDLGVSYVQIWYNVKYGYY